VRGAPFGIGSHIIEYESSGLADGVYFYTIYTDAGIEVILF